MNLIQQLADYQNAPIDSLEAAKKGANPNISPWVAGAILSDRIEKQKRMAMQQGAAQGQQPTVDEQQDQEVAGIMQALSPQAQPAQQAQPQMQKPVMAAEGGLMQAKVDPRMFDFCGGGIIAFGKGGDVEDDTVYDPITGVPIAGASTREGEDLTLREAMGLGNVENRRALERAEKERTAPRKPSLAEQYEKAQREGNAAGATPYVPPPPKREPPPAGGAKPAGSGAPAAGKGVMALLTNSPEWKAMEAARTKPFEAPEMAKTPAELAAERAAHLKAQGITETPWDTAAKQTAELQRLMSEQAAERKSRREEDTGRKGYREIVANMGAGSFGQSGSAGLRAHYKAEADREAEDQRLRELDYTRQTKLNEINAKAQELRYNEATGDVAAAQKNRQDLAKLKRDYEKDSAAVANQQATLRERAAAADLTAATTLAAARERSGASGVLTPFQLAKIRDMAADNVKDTIRAGGVPMQMELKKDPGMRDRMVEKETKRILASYGVEGAQAPVQSQYGPPPQGAVRLKK
jgi:hypothetical protein